MVSDCGWVGYGVHYDHWDSHQGGRVVPCEDSECVSRNKGQVNSKEPQLRVA